MKDWLSNIFGGQKPPAASPVDVTVAQAAQGGAGMDRTIAASVPSDPQALQGAEAQVAAEWAVGYVILDTYEVKQIHEGGGMGLVYRVRHRDWRQDLAVKSPRAEYFTFIGAAYAFHENCRKISASAHCFGNWVDEELWHASLRSLEMEFSKAIYGRY
jgi:hypothetical protein